MWTPLGFRFAQPEWLWALPLLLLVVGVRGLMVARRPGASLTFSSLETLHALPASLWLRLRWVPAALRATILALIVVALARPQFGFSRENVENLGVDIVLAVDVSDSMQADDLQPNRLAVAKYNMTKFVEGRPSDNFAIVGFGDVAAVLCPLTPEYDIIRQFIERLTFQVLGGKTALGDAIALASRQLDKSDAESKVIVLLTDGTRTAGEFDPKGAAEIAAALGVRIYTIGIGSTDQRRGFFQMAMLQADFDPDLLKEIARLTGGAYFHASDNNRFEQIFDEINKLERTRRERTTNRQFEDKMIWFAAPALLLLLLEFLLTRTRLRRLP